MLTFGIDLHMHSLTIKRVVQKPTIQQVRLSWCRLRRRIEITLPGKPHFFQLTSELIEVELADIPHLRRSA
ncbi:hypothetical protein CEK69_18160 [Xanthomonas sp. LMG 12462]|nr:hypothetical protein CEK69_18160 [Xanthomonas sp. LMG 12462]